MEQILPPIGEPWNWLFAGLDFHAIEVDATPEDPRGRAGLEAPEFNPGLEKAGRQRFGAKIA